MTKRALWLMLIVVASGPLAGLAKKQAPKRPLNEPFSSFEQMDRALTSLTRQQEQLGIALAPADGSKATETKRGSGRRWAAPAEDMRRSARRVRSLAERQQRRYRTLQQQFGVRAFRALASRAANVEKVAQQIRTTRNAPAAAERRSDLDGSVLLLVRQFQSITGGYGAARCSTGERPCCIAKDGGTDEVVACSWICVRAAGACREGFSGPAARKK